MPVATPLPEALRTARLEEKVAAVARIATTLDRLWVEFGMAHRDIKPQNLYRYDNDWVVGDFGLVSLPDADSLTRDDRQVGPANFLPYEMIASPSNASGGPVDVYSFAKTLWVLASSEQ